MTDKGGSNIKQVGFVRFSSTQDAAAALQQMNGYQLDADAPALVGMLLIESCLTLK